MESFSVYRPEQMTEKNSISNLRKKLADPQFKADTGSLVRRDAPPYDIDAAGDYIEKTLLSKL